MSFFAIWKFLESGAGQILAILLGIGAILLRSKVLKGHRDKARRAAEIAKSEAKVERATTKINKAFLQKRAAAAKEQHARVEREQAEAEAEGKRRDIGGGW